MKNRIRRTRKRKGLKQYELAGRVGLDPATLSRMENGYVPSDEDLQKKLARALGCKVSALWPE